MATTKKTATTAGAKKAPAQKTAPKGGNKVSIKPTAQLRRADGKIKALIWRYGYQPQITLVQNKLEEWYKIIGCTTIDIVSGRINGVPVDIIVDDEGKLNENTAKQITGFFMKDGKVLDTLVGTLIITGFADEDGELTDLPEKALEKVNAYEFSQGDNKTFCIGVDLL